MDAAAFKLLLIFPQTVREPGSTQLTCPLPAVSLTVNVFNVQTGLVLGHDATALRKLPVKGLPRRVRQVVLHPHPILHQHLTWHDQNHPIHSFSFGAWQRLGQPVASVVDLIYSGTGAELDEDPRTVMFAGFVPIPVNEFEETEDGRMWINE